MSKLHKRVWSNNNLTVNTKMLVYKACVLSTLLYSSESWTSYAAQGRRLNTFHLRCLRRILGIKWQDRIPTPTYSNKWDCQPSSLSSASTVSAGSATSAEWRMAEYRRTCSTVSSQKVRDPMAAPGCASRTRANET